MSLPLEVLARIADWTQWFPLREVCKTFREVAPMDRRTWQVYWGNTLMTCSEAGIRYIYSRYLKNRIPRINDYIYEFIFYASPSFYLAARGDVQLLESLTDIFPYIGCMYEFRNMAHIAVHNGNMEMLKYIRRHSGCIPEICWVRDGDTSTLEWIASEQDHLVEEIRKLVHQGKCKTVTWLLDHSVTPYWTDLRECLEVGRFDLANRMLEAGCPLHYGLYDLDGDGTSLKWVLDHNCPWPEYLLDAYIVYDNLTQIKMCVEAGYPLSSFLTTFAAYLGRYRILRWLLTTDVIVDPVTLGFLRLNLWNAKDKDIPIIMEMIEMLEKTGVSYEGEPNILFLDGKCRHGFLIYCPNKCFVNGCLVVDPDEDDPY